MVDITKALQDALAFMEEAGALAVANQATAAHEFKADDSIVTETDLAISKLAHARLADWLAQGHVLVDEESITQTGKPVDVFANSTCQWVLDPIDGTANYASGRHSYGTMLALLEDGQPLLAALSLPAQGVLVYGTADGVFKVTNAFTDAAVTTPVTGFKPRPVHPQNYMDMSRHYFLKGNWNGLTWANTPESAVQGGVDAVLGQSSGLLSSQKYSVWDVMATWALVRFLGGTVYHFETKEPIEKIEAVWFQENWKTRSGWLFAPETTLDILYNRLTERTEEAA